MAGDETIEPGEGKRDKRMGRLALFLAVGVGWLLLVVLLIGAFSGGDDDADVATRLNQNGRVLDEGEGEEEDGGSDGDVELAAGDDDGGEEPATGSSASGEAPVTEGRAPGGGSAATTTTARSSSGSPSGPAGSTTTAAPAPTGGGGGGSGTTAPPVTTTTTTRPPSGATTTSPSTTTTSSTLPPTTTTTAPGTPPPSSASISIVDSTFQPSEVTIAAGGTVTMSNDDNRVHSWRFSAEDDTTLGANDPPVTRSFPDAGTYAFSCRFHRQMTGRVIVV